MFVFILFYMHIVNCLSPVCEVIAAEATYTFRTDDCEWSQFTKHIFIRSNSLIGKERKAIHKIFSLLSFAFGLKKIMYIYKTLHPWARFFGFRTIRLIEIESTGILGWLVVLSIRIKMK